MHLYDPDFLFVFLPVFIAVYALLPAKVRPALISIADLVFLYTSGIKSVIGFAAVTGIAYFTGISLYNSRRDPEKTAFRKKQLRTVIPVIIGFSVILSVTGNSGGERVLLSPASVYCWTVIPLHLISYILDVYRGDCEATTKLSSLAAYAGFFPSASFGPILKYKCFENTFRAPKLSLKKLAAGIRLYIFGLAEYLIIARRLEAVRTELISAPDSLREGTGWFFVPLFYVMFAVSVLGMIHMGRGVSLMLGFSVRPDSRKEFFTGSLTKRLRQMNEPLASWLHDYIYKPVRLYSEKDNSALICTVCVGTMWYSLSAGWLITGLVTVGLIALQNELYKRRIMLDKKIRGLSTKIFILAAAAVCAFMEHPSAAIKIFGSASGTENAFIGHLISETAVPFTIGLILSGSFIPWIIRRVNNVWLKVIVPVAEIFLLIISVSFMLNLA